MRRHHCITCILLLVLAALTLPFAVSGNSSKALAESTGADPVTFTIVDSGGDPSIPDVIDSRDGSVHLDVSSIEGTGSADTAVVAISTDTVTWHLTAPNAGTVAIQGCSSIAFSGIDGLVGGVEDDAFDLSPGAWLGLTIDGGPGANTLDYSAFSTGVAVDLDGGTATLTNGVSNIQTVIGGAGYDTLTGNSSDNSFTSGLGKDTISGGEGFDTLTETRDANFVLSTTALTIGSGDASEKDTLSGIDAVRLTDGPGAHILNASTCSLPVVLDGAEGHDTLRGGSAADVLIGGAGDDLMAGGAGDDEYRGGPGLNTLTEAIGRGNDTAIESFDGDFSLTDSSLVWAEGTDQPLVNIENVRLSGGPGDNDFDVSALAGVAVSVEGGAGHDTLVVDPHGAQAGLITDAVVVTGFQPVNYGSVEAVAVDGDAVVSADATMRAREYSLGSLTVGNYSVLTLASDTSATGFPGVKITTSSDLTITAGSLISADGQGYAAGQGPGAGATAGSVADYFGGGGGYGGPGGNGDGGAQGGATYGSATEPEQLGSGGGNDGGAGGGAIRLVVGGTLLVDGGIVCGGEPGGDDAGGGSGGSIYLTVGTLAGTGTISSDGGDASEGGGGGGGGRIAVYCGTDTFSGAMTASGGAGFEPGGSGILPPEAYLKDAITALRGLAVTDFRNSKSASALADKLELAIASIDAGLYNDALKKLQRDVLPKMDGCSTGGAPDKDDWLITPVTQQEVYELILQATGLLGDLV